jgi:hypothetical protein
MFKSSKDKDERAIAVENSSFSLAYKVIAFAILVDVIYRSLVLKEVSWDLLGIVILGGLVATLYQTRYKTGTRSWVKAALLSFLAALVIAAVLGLTKLMA